MQQRAHTTTQVLIRHLQLYSEDHIKQEEQDMEDKRITWLKLENGWHWIN